MFLNYKLTWRIHLYIYHTWGIHNIKHEQTHSQWTALSIYLHFQAEGEQQIGIDVLLNSSPVVIVSVQVPTLPYILITERYRVDTYPSVNTSDYKLAQFIHGNTISPLNCRLLRHPSIPHSRWTNKSRKAFEEDNADAADWFIQIIN